MKSKKTLKLFSEAYIKLAYDAGINNTFIPDTWKEFFKSSSIYKKKKGAGKANAVAKDELTGNASAVKSISSSAGFSKKSAFKRSSKTKKNVAITNVVTGAKKVVSKSSSRLKPVKKSSSRKKVRS